MSDDHANLAARLRAALATLPWAEHRVFVLHAVEGMDYDVIAERLVLTVPDVELLLAAALVRLDRHLSGDDADHGRHGNGA